MEKVNTGTDHLLFEKGDGVAILTMNRPEARNAMSGEMNEAMQIALSEIEVDPETVSYTHLPSPRDLSTSRMPSSA